MKYIEMLNDQSAGKLISDLAYLLDHGLFQLDKIKEEYQRVAIAALREEAFHDFCALCIQSGIPVPAMELGLLTVQAPSADNKALEDHSVRVKTFVEPALAKLAGCDDAKAELCKAFAKSYAGLPSFSAKYSNDITAKQLECAINLILIELGKEPIRPDYQSREIKTATMAPSRKELRVLIVDDDRQEIFRTARSLAGWKDLNLSFYHYESSANRFSIKNEKNEEELSKTARTILGMKPDIVLMDQGLVGIEGSDLVLRILELNSDTAPLFVANTAGDDEKLRSVGALQNCRKGKDLKGVAAAISRF